MQGTTIEDSVINSPFVEPKRHFVMADGQPTKQQPSEIVNEIRQSVARRRAEEVVLT